MIGFFRRHRSWILWAITAAIVVTMLPWGTVSWSAIFSGDASPAVGTILGETVTLREIESLLGRRGGAAPEEVEDAFWRLAVLRYAESQGFTPAPETVEAYARMIHGRRPGPPAPEAVAFARYQMTTATFQQAVSASVSGSDLECYEQFLADDEERQAKYVALKAETLSFLGQDADVSNTEIQREYDRLKLLPADGPERGFRTEEMVRLELAFLPRASVSAGISVTDEEARAEYEAKKDILYKQEPPAAENPAATPVASAPAYVPLENVASAIKERLGREKAAKALSQKLADAQRLTSDAASYPEDIPAVAKRFGMAYQAEAGPFARKDLVKIDGTGDLSAAAGRIFAAPVGSIQTAEVPDGGLLYRVLERTPAGATPLAEVEGAIRDRLHAAKTFEKVEELARELQRKADEFSLESAVQHKLDEWKKVHVFSEPPLAVATTEFFKARDASVTGVGASPDFRRQAFGLPRPPTEEEQRKRPGLPEGPKHAVAVDEALKTAFVLTVGAARPPDPRGFAGRKEELRRRVIGVKQEVLLENLAAGLKDPEIAEFTYQAAKR